jgi:hypothetical protein
MRNTTRALIGVLLAGALVMPAAAAEAQGRGNSKPKKVEQKQKAAVKADKAQRKADGKDDAVVIDRDAHARVVREYRTAGSLPPGLAKRESLPPGLRRQLVERGTLPPGLQKHLIDVPGSLAPRLPPLPAHYRRYFVGDDMIVVDTRSNTVVRIIENVW